MHHPVTFSIPSIRAFVPEKLRPWIVVLIVIVFQLSGGVYLAAVSEMVGSTALMQEDIMMAGYASLVGMGLTFAIMFRLKFRFPSKTALQTCAGVILLCNLICIYTHSVPVLVCACFVAGVFRMWATFECNSTIQLWITPKRDLSVFFCYIYLLVQGCMQFSGLLTVYTAVWAKWEYMHWLVIGLLVLMMCGVQILFRHHRSMPRLPLFGIDWLGAFMWGLTTLCAIFVCVYGEYYDWYASPYIRAATVAGVTVLLLNLWRASFIRHPYIALNVFTYRVVYINALLYIVIDLLLAPSHLFEHIYMEAVLGYDALHTISLNWVVVLGVVAGSAFTYVTFALRKWRYKTMILISFASLAGYLMYFYFTIDYNAPKELLVIPVFLRTFGYVIVSICFLTALIRVPFHHFFQAITVQSLVSAGLGGALGTAILDHALRGAMAKNALLLSATLDRVNPVASHLPAGQLMSMLQQQALMVSMKELLGWLTLFSLFCLLVLLLTESDIRPHRVLHPSFRIVRRLIKHELRMGKKDVA